MSGRGGRQVRGGGARDFGGGRGGGRMTAGQRPVTEGTRIHIDVQLERFKSSDESEIVFPPDMSRPRPRGGPRVLQEARFEEQVARQRRGEARARHEAEGVQAGGPRGPARPEAPPRLLGGAVGPDAGSLSQPRAGDCAGDRPRRGSPGTRSTAWTAWTRPTRGSHSGRKGKRARGPPPLLMRPFTSVAPEEASRRAEAHDFARRAIWRRRSSAAARPRSSSCARVPRGLRRSRAGTRWCSWPARPGAARPRRSRST